MPDAHAILHVRVNGEPHDVPAPATVGDLLDRLNVPRTHTAVERNREIVSRADFDRTELADQDVLEIVTLVGGG